MCIRDSNNTCCEQRLPPPLFNKLWEFIKRNSTFHTLNLHYQEKHASNINVKEKSKEVRRAAIRSTRISWRLYKAWIHRWLNIKSDKEAILKNIYPTQQTWSIINPSSKISIWNWSGSWTKMFYSTSYSMHSMHPWMGKAQALPSNSRESFFSTSTSDEHFTFSTFTKVLHYVSWACI